MASVGQVNRMPNADLCRVVAIFGVILIHTAAPVFYNYRVIALQDFLIANGIDSIARVSVPLFAMLSGALLLGRDVDAQYLSVFRRVLKVSIPLLFWSLIYYVWINYWSGLELNILTAVKQAFNGPVMYHLWFVYMIIGLYVALPMLQIVSVKMLSSVRFSAYLLITWFIINCVTVYYPIPLFNHLVLAGFLKWAGYFLLGFYIYRSSVFQRVSMFASAVVFCGASAATFLISWWLNANSPAPLETAFEYLSPNVVVASCAAFNILMKIAIPHCWGRPLAYFSGLSFAVYFMHLLVIELIKAGMFGFTIDFQSMPAIFGIPILAVLTFVIASLLSAIGHIVPFAHRVIG